MVRFNITNTNKSTLVLKERIWISSFLTIRSNSFQVFGVLQNLLALFRLRHHKHHFRTNKTKIDRILFSKQVFTIIIKFYRFYKHFTCGGTTTKIMKSEPKIKEWNFLNSLIPFQNKKLHLQNIFYSINPITSKE